MLWQPVFQQGFESGVFDGLGQIVVHAGGDAQFAIAFHGIGGHGDDGQVLALCRLAFLTAQDAGGHSHPCGIWQSIRMAS
jgi:ketosteroid isomerase-like protein